MNKRVVIIGAGAAGIAAATKLVSNGFQNVVVLEAENRIGGRINTVPFGANNLDMGAQWCHGEKDNVVFEMAKDKNLLSSNIPRYKSFLLVQSDGTMIDQHLSDKLMELGMAIIEGYEDEKNAFNGSLGNFLMEKYRKALRETEFSDVGEELGSQFYDFLHKFENSIEASNSWYETSSRSFSQYWTCEGDPLMNWKDKGYVTVFDLLQKKLPSKGNDSVDISSNILFNKEVQKITYNQPINPIQIECNDGSAYNADHLICTVSLGVLKERHLQMFDPFLPPAKIDSIDGMAFGTVDKIYLEFDEPFWPTDWTGFSLLWKPQQLKVIRDDVNGDWLQDVFGFYTVSFQPNVLCGWISGPKARRMEQASDVAVQNGVIKLLRLFLRQWNVPDARHMIRSKWYSNLHFRGSYSYYSLKSDALDASTTTLAEPINDANGKPIIQFGGEATSLHYYSTVHGAIESGWREAKRITDLYTRK